MLVLVLVFMFSLRFSSEHFEHGDWVYILGGTSAQEQNGEGQGGMMTGIVKEIEIV